MHRKIIHEEIIDWNKDQTFKQNKHQNRHCMKLIFISLNISFSVWLELFTLEVHLLT